MRPDPDRALSLQLPNFALNFVALELAQLCAQGYPEKVLDVYNDTACEIADKYQSYPTLLIANGLNRLPNPDLDVRTCVANVYCGVAAAHLMIAVTESGKERQATLRAARGFTDRAEAFYCRGEPS